MAATKGQAELINLKLPIYAIVKVPYYTHLNIIVFYAGLKCSSLTKLLSNYDSIIIIFF